MDITKRRIREKLSNTESQNMTDSLKGKKRRVCVRRVTELRVLEIAGRFLTS
jgi:hypothetical protein